MSGGIKDQHTLKAAAAARGRRHDDISDDECFPIQVTAGGEARLSMEVSRGAGGHRKEIKW